MKSKILIVTCWAAFLLLIPICGFSDSPGKTNAADQAALEKQAQEEEIKSLREQVQNLKEKQTAIQNEVKQLETDLGETRGKARNVSGKISTLHWLEGGLVTLLFFPSWLLSKIFLCA